MTSSIFLMPLTISRVEVEPFLNTLKQHRAAAIDVDHIGLHRAAVVHLRHVVHVHHRPAHALDRQVGEVRDLGRRIIEVDGVLVVADLLGPGRCQKVLSGERVGDILSCQAEGLHGAGIEVVHDLRRLSSEWKRNTGTLHGDQPRAHEIEPEVREVLLRETLAGQCQLNDGHRRGAVVRESAAVSRRAASASKASARWRLPAHWPWRY